MKFKNLFGNYQAPSEGGDPPKAPLVYPPGSVFESDVDLTRHNRAGVKIFERMPDDADIRIAEPRDANELDNPTPVDPQDVFSGMTVPELREEAANAGIDLGKNTKKADIQAILRKAATGVDSGDE